MLLPQLSQVDSPHLGRLTGACVGPVVVPSPVGTQVPVGICRTTGRGLPTPLGPLLKTILQLLELSNPSGHQGLPLTSSLSSRVESWGATA